MDLTWYNSLNKPAFTPPMTTFMPVWTILYVFMAISFYLVFKKGWKKKEIRSALKLFLLQLVFNLIWSPIFFGLHNIAGGLVIILVMWYLIYKTIKAFKKIDDTAAILMYPYLAWVSIATLLNLSLLLLNS